MAEIGLAEAARLTGKNRSTLHRAMKTGRLSYTVNDAGQRQIDVAELQRVFDLRSPPPELVNGATRAGTPASLQRHSAQRGEVAALREIIDTLRATVASQEATIRSIQTEKQQLLALLTDQRRPWWRRWLR